MGHREFSTAFPRLQPVSPLVWLPAQAYLYQAGDPSTTAFMIRSGIVSLESVNHRGERCIVQFLGPGSFIGHEAWMGQRRCFDARACIPTVLEPGASPPGPIRLNGVFTDAGMAVSKLLHEITRFRVELHRASARQRVLLLLEQLRKAHPANISSIWLPSRQEMADTLDINHVTASRVVAQLFRERVLRRVHRSDEVGVDWIQVQRLLHTEPLPGKRCMLPERSTTTAS